MNWRLVIVWSIKLALAAFVLWLGYRWLHGFEQVYAKGDPNAVVNSFFKFLLVGGIIVAIFFLDLVMGLSNRMTNVIMPQVDDVELRPEYSEAEARARQGKYEESIALFRKVWKKYPNDVNAHVRIAEILCQHFQQYDGAVVELKAALEKKVKPETWAFLANRLADIEAEYRHDYVAARDALQQVMLKFPNTSHATSAMARVRALNDKEAHDLRPQRTRLKLPQKPDTGSS
jgi:tetratricopeptide (TPR) repeat protein